MILQREIVSIAETKRVSKSTIDKDWALGHFIAAIYSEPELKEALIFKGGTCLKKCYFPDYRFSEDLDFTARKKEFELTKSTFKIFARMFSKRLNCLPTLNPSGL
jgi:predicted nucleotidyltransferase component of viral defense system